MAVKEMSQKEMQEIKGGLNVAEAAAKPVMESTIVLQPATAIVPPIAPAKPV